jgi:hypothetical protein
VGYQALFVGGGSGNSALGLAALRWNASGASNTALGVQALMFNTHGQNNTAVGGDALSSNSIGSHNVAVGYNAGRNASASSNNSIFIANTGLNGDTGVIKIGTQGTQTQTYIAGIHGATSESGIAVLVDSSGRLGTTTSSRRYKQDIASMNDMSAILQKLRPVTFRYKQAADDGSKPLQYGLIAEEVFDVFSDLVAFNKDGTPETVKYHLLPSFLLAAYQQQHKVIEAQQEQISDQTGRIGTQQEQIAEQRQQMAVQAAEIATLKQQMQHIEAMLVQGGKQAHSARHR